MPNEIYYLELDKAASIKCHAQALTPPLIHWLKLSNGVAKLPEHIYEERGTLHFEKVKREDEGSYMCVATHRQQGLINATVTVRIVGKMLPESSLHTFSYLEQNLKQYLPCNQNCHNPFSLQLGQRFHIFCSRIPLLFFSFNFPVILSLCDSVFS